MRLRQLLKVTACGVAMAALTNCAGWQQRMAQFEYDTSSDACVAVGYTEAHPQHEECIANTTAARRAQGQREAQETILGGLMLGLAIRGSGTNAGPTPTSRSSSAEESSHLATSEMVRNKAIDQPAVRLCPNGNYVYGTECRLAPNGQYLPGPATLAPDGQYVVGRPQITPDGTYVGGNGRVLLCPDGSYVSGERCILTPDGGYVGGP